LSREEVKEEIEIFFPLLIVVIWCRWRLVSGRSPPPMPTKRLFWWRILGDRDCALATDTLVYCLSHRATGTTVEVEALEAVDEACTG